MKMFTNLKMGGVNEIIHPLSLAKALHLKALRLLLVAVFASVCNIVSADDVYATLTFPDGNSKKVSNYTTTWTATCDNYTWSIANFNNNNNGWSYIRCGSNKNASTAYIATTFAIDKPVTSVVVTIDKVTSASVNSIYMVVSSDEGFSTEVEKVALDDVSTGDKTFSVQTPTAGYYYKLVFDCAKVSNNGIVQVSKVVYNVESGSVATKCATPKITPSSQKFADKVNVSISCATEKAKIYYTTDGSTPTDQSTEYTGAFDVTATTTVQAIAYADGLEASSVAEATYTKVEALSGLKALREKIESDNSSTATEYTVNLTNAVVTKVGSTSANSSSDNVAILEEDGTGIYVYMSSHGLSAGDVLSGLVTVKGMMYNNGYAELTSLSGYTKKAGTAPEPTEVTAAQLNSDFATYGLRYVVLKNAEVTTAITSSERNGAVSQDGTSLAVRSANTDVTMNANQTVDIKGVAVLYSNATQLMLFSNSDYSLCSTGVEAPTFSPAAGTYAEAQTVTIASATEGATIMYTTDGTEPSATEGTAYTDAGITVDKTMTVKAIAIKDGVASQVATAEYKILTLTGDGTLDNPYTVSDVQTLKLLNKNYGESANKVWVKGKILGSVTGSGTSIAVTQTYSNSNMMLGDTDDESTFIPIECKSGFQTYVGLENHSEYVGKEIVVNGVPQKYFGVAGVKSIIGYRGFGSITVGEDLYTTYYNSFPYEMPEGLQGGYITEASVSSEDAASGTLTINYDTYPAGNNVPAGNALLIKAEKAGTYELTLVNCTAQLPEGNLLHGADAVDDGNTYVDGTNVKYYILTHGAGDKADVFGFFYAEADGAATKYVAPHAFLAVDFGASSKAISMFSLDGETTGISSVSNGNVAESDAVYTLSGVRVAKSCKLSKGLYIMNGKKVLVK